jgi:phosphonate transport system permease protein
MTDQHTPSGEAARTGVGDAAVESANLVTARPRPGPRPLLALLLAAAVLASLLALDAPEGLLDRGGLRVAGDMLASALSPDLSPAFLAVVAEATLLTLAYAVAGISVALLLGLPGAVLVSGTLAHRTLTRLPLVGGSRGVFATLRAPHELVWGVLFVQVVGFHPLAGILAIGLPYAAIIARVLGERLQDVPQGPLAALRSAGASPAQVLGYARVPVALPDMIGYVLYRFECAVRVSAVLSVIGLGGIGHQLELVLYDLRYEAMWPLLAALVLVIVAIDRLSARLRRAVGA